MSLTDKDNMRMHKYSNFECAWVLEDTYEDMIKGNRKKGIDLDIKFEIWLFLLTSSSHFGFVLGLFRGSSSVSGLELTCFPMRENRDFFCLCRFISFGPLCQN